MLPHQLVSNEVVMWWDSFIQEWYRQDRMVTRDHGLNHHKWSQLCQFSQEIVTSNKSLTTFVNTPSLIISNSMFPGSGRLVWKLIHNFANNHNHKVKKVKISIISLAPWPRPIVHTTASFNYDHAILWIIMFWAEQMYSTLRPYEKHDSWHDPSLLSLSYSRSWDCSLISSLIWY